MQWPLSAAADATGISDRAARKWLARYRTEERRVEVIAVLRPLRITGAEIAEALGMGLSTVSGTLTRIAMGKLGRLALEPARRYERTRPGRSHSHRRQEARTFSRRVGKRWRDGHRKHYTGSRTDAEGARRNLVGWDYVHVAIDDATRLADLARTTGESARGHFHTVYCCHNAGRFARERSAALGHKDVGVRRTSENLGDYLTGEIVGSLPLAVYS
jgi:hypothetical protein